MTNPSRTTVLKLRHSCEACALSKVKCQKQKPTCSRCQRRGVECHYLAIKRAGRRYSNPRVDSTQLSPLVGSGPHLELSDLNTWLGTSTTTISTDSNSDDLFLRQLLSTTTSSMGTPFIQTPAGNSALTQSNDEILVGHSTPSVSTPCLTSNSLEIGSVVLSPINLSMDIDDYLPSTMNLWTPRIPDTSNINSIPPLGSGNEPQHLHTDTVTTPTTEHDTCIKRSLQIMQQQFRHRINPQSRNSACELCKPDSGTDSPALTLDSVIESNKQAMDAVNTMLPCQCLQDGYLLTILSLIVFKVLESYSAAASAPEAQESDAGCAEDNAPCMAAQRVLGELHRVQRLVNQLSVHIKSHITAENQGITQNTSTGCGQNRERGFTLPFSSEILEKLEADMRTRLKRLSLGMAAHLRRD